MSEHRVVYEEHPQYGTPRGTCACGTLLIAKNVGTAHFPAWSIAAALGEHIRAGVPTRAEINGETT